MSEEYEEYIKDEIIKMRKRIVQLDIAQILVGIFGILWAGYWTVVGPLPLQIFEGILFVFFWFCVVRGFSRIGEDRRRLKEAREEYDRK